MNRQLPQTQNKTFVYSYYGTNIVAQEVTNGTSLDYEYFFYDASGSPVGMNYLGNNYLFKKNLQGDIIEIWGTADGSSRSDFRKLVTYTYDAWGNITSMVDTTDNWYRVGTANPFRYRGYYYDNESGLYYLQSRYYDPVTGRFLNADKRFDINLQNNNLFAYCLNNPINLIDKNGEDPSYINNQNDNNVKNIKWGLAGNTWANGCGWIAVYNVMLSYSKKITYQYVINGLTLAGGVLGFGKLGADPRGITKYLKSKFWFVYTAGPITYLWGIKSELSGGIIVLYQHKGWNSSLHYVAGIKVGGGTGGSFRFYNDSYYKQRYGSKAISIWQYIDLLKANGCKLVMFWGVSGKKGRW